MDSDEERDKCADAFDAIRYNEIGKLENLLENVRADIIDRNNKINTLLHYAVEKGNKDIVELLLHPKRKVNIHATNIVGNTPLHIAALKNNVELVRSLLSKGAKSDIENDEGDTPLDLARGPEVIGIFESADGTSRSHAAIPKSDAKNVGESSKQDKEYEKREGTSGMRGWLYEIELAMLYLLHGNVGFESKTLLDYRFASNVEGVDGVGNLIFECRYKERNGTEKSKITFVQTKHKENVKKEDESNQRAKQQPFVANKRDGWFLKDHFCAYRKVRDKFSEKKSDASIFGGSFEDCEFVIFTNIPFRDYSNGYEVNATKEAVERQSIFDFRREETDRHTGTKSRNQYYKLSMGGNKDDELVAVVNRSLSSEKKRSSSEEPASKDEIDEYFGKLKIFCEQPNESELRVIISDKIRSIYRVRASDVNRVFADVEDKTRLWWIHENVYLTQNNRFFQDSARVSIGFGVKKPVDLFTGRHRELGELHRSLQRSQGRSNCDVTSQTSCVTGLGGIGKTQVAREYIKQYSRCYDDNVIWMNAESDESLHREFKRLAQDKLNIATKNAHQKEKDISSIVAETYSFFAKRRSIFVFDNADETENLEDFLPLKALPANAKRPHILITSRRNEWYDGVDVVKLGEFTTTEATEFVRKKLGLDEKNDAMNRSLIRLVEVLQRFPLAIQQAISYIRNQSLTGDASIDEYLQTFEQNKQVLLDWKLGSDKASDYERTTYTTWKMTIDKIGETRIGKLALEILDVIAHLASNDIRREMFSTLARDNDSELRAAVRQLVKFSMINGEQRQSILHVHKLVQQVTRLEQTRRGTEAEILQKTWRLLKHNLRCGDDPIEYFTKRHLFPHCEVFLLHFDGAPQNQREKLKIEDDDLVHGLLQMSRVFFHNRFPEHLMNFNARILRIAEEHCAPDDSRLIPILEGAGSSYSNFMAYLHNARDIFERVLNIREKQYGKDHPPVVETLVTISRISKTLLSRQEQKDFIERAVDIVAKLEVCNPSEVSFLLHKLALDYFSYRHERRRLYERLSAIAQPRSPEGEDIHAKLAMLETNHYPNIQPSREMTIDDIEHALSCVRTYYRESNFEMPNSQLRTNLANIYGSMKNYQVQTKLLERGVDILENDHGTDHPKVAATLVTLGIAYENLGDYLKKRAQVHRALEIRINLHGPDHIIVANTLINLADVYGKLNDLRYEKEILERVLHMTQEYFGLDESPHGHILILLSINHERRGDIAGQQELLSRIAKIWPRLPPNHSYHAVSIEESWDTLVTVMKYVKHQESIRNENSLPSLGDPV